MSPVAIILLSIAGMFLYNCIKYRKKDNTEKTDAIGELSKKAHGYVEKNVESIAKLRDAMNKFKVE